MVFGIFEASITTASYGSGPGLLCPTPPSSGLSLAIDIEGNGYSIYNVFYVILHP